MQHCVIYLLLHTHTHTGCYVTTSSLALAHHMTLRYDILLFQSDEEPHQGILRIYKAQFGKVTTERQHEKRMDNIQLKLLVVK